MNEVVYHERIFPSQFYVLRKVEEHCSKQSHHRWRCGCRPYVRPAGPLNPGRLLIPVAVSRRVDLGVSVRLEGLGQLENPVTSLGIELAPFRLVAYSLPRGHCRHSAYRMHPHYAPLDRQKFGVEGIVCCFCRGL
jgi:hypothetical protein